MPSAILTLANQPICFGLVALVSQARSRTPPRCLELHPTTMWRPSGTGYLVPCPLASVVCQAHRKVLNPCVGTYASLLAILSHCGPLQRPKLHLWLRARTQNCLLCHPVSPFVVCGLYPQLTPFAPACCTSQQIMSQTEYQLFYTAVAVVLAALQPGQSQSPVNNLAHSLGLQPVRLVRPQLCHGYTCSNPNSFPPRSSYLSALD